MNWLAVVVVGVTPKKSVASLLPEVDASAESGVAGAAKPSVAGNAVVAERRAGSTFVPRDFSGSGADVHAAVEAVCSSVLIGYARLVVEDVLTKFRRIMQI